MTEFTTDGLNMQGLATAINSVAETLQCGTAGGQLREEISRLRKIAYRINQMFTLGPDRQPLPFRLEEMTAPDGELNCRIDLAGGCIVVMPDGYATKTDLDGQGTPIVVELHTGKLRVVAWADINQEDPTHIIEMEGARESLRRD